MPDNNWYAITGAPSSGKSTLISELQRRGYSVCKDAAREIIDDGLKRGVSNAQMRRDVEAFQTKILRRKVELGKSSDKKTMTFFDCGLHDTIAFFNLYQLTITRQVNEMLKTARYKGVFLLQPLGRYTKDYARTESEEDALKLNDLLHEAYDKAGMRPVIVPPVSVSKRTDFVLKLCRD